MAVYDGFFDAVLDENTGEYDRAYASGDFTSYFEKIIGSGVCVHNDPDSFRVRMADGNAVVSPGYLFIQGYWLCNDADYTLPLTGSATLAIIAHLNQGKRMIELEAVSVAQAYPDSLVLALVNPAAGTAEDTRYNTDICGIIDTAGELSKKVEWAVNYIDNEIEDKLAAAEADIAAQSRRLDAKIAEVQAQVDKIAPPAVGTIKFSASQDVGEEWLRCNGDFISESQYPELVAALGKLIPSGDKFQLLSDGEIGPQISNGVVYAGRMWVYSYSDQKLYGVDLNGKEPVKSIFVSGEGDRFSNFTAPANSKPIALSIVTPKGENKSNLYLTQVSNGRIDDFEIFKSCVLIYCSEFVGNEENLVLTEPLFTSLSKSSLISVYANPQTCIPYVISNIESGVNYLYLSISGRSSTDSGIAIKWTKNGEEVEILPIGSRTNTPANVYLTQRVAYSHKNQNEAVIISVYNPGGLQPTITSSIQSSPNGIFSRDSSPVGDNIPSLQVPCPMNVAGADDILFEFDKTSVGIIERDHLTPGKVVPITGISLLSSARVFPDGAAYLWGKDVYMIFVGTGILFSRTLEEGSFGYLDTTSVLGTITQFGYLDYSQDEGTLYIVGQDTANRVKVAKIVLNTLYDYANDGAWLPMIAADGVPAYIKAKEET